MNTPEDIRPGRSWLSPSTVLILCLGVLVPIIAALIPVARMALRAHDFRYSISGPVTVGKRVAFAVTAVNRGRQTEKDVQIWIPYDAKDAEFEYELTWVPRGTRTRDDRGYKVFVIGDLEHDEMARISIMFSAPSGPLSMGNTRDEQLVPALAPRIVSSRGEAQWVPATRRASNMRYVYQAGFWGFVILVVTAILWGVTASRAGQRFLQRR